MTAKRCGKVRELLSAYLDGELDPATRAAVEEHLRECGPCGAELEELKAASAFVQDLPEAELPEDFHPALVRRVRAEARLIRARSVARAAGPGLTGRLADIWTSLITGVRRSPLRSAAAVAALVILVVWTGAFVFYMGLLVPNLGEMAKTQQDRAGSPGLFSGGAAPDSSLGDPRASGKITPGASGEITPGASGEITAGSGGSGGVGTLGLGSEPGRKVILNAFLTIGCDDVGRARDRVIVIAENAGGFVESLNYWTDAAGAVSASLSVRVPVGAVAGVLESLRTLGDVLGEQVSRVDVTAEHIDLTARVTNLRQQEQRLLALLGRAQSLTDVLVLENELNRVRTDIERYEKTLRSLEERIAYSTISVNLQPRAAGPKPDAGLWERMVDAFLKSLAWMVGLAEKFIIFLAALLPLAVVLGLLWLAVSGFRARRRQRPPGI